MNTRALALASVLMLGCTTAAAHAADETFSFSGNDSAGAFTASIVLDVVNGQAISGSDGMISGTDINGSQALVLLTGSSADTSPYGSGFLKGSDNGTNVAFDDQVLIDSAYGLAFTIGGVSIGHDDKAIFNIYSDGSSSTGYTGFFSGRGSVDPATSSFEGTGDTSVLINDGSVSAAPEPSTWALMFGAVGIVGGMLRLAVARRREDMASA